MPNEQVVELERRTAYLGVEVQSTWLKAAVLDDFHHCECGGIRVSRHLISIPAKKGVALVGVDASQLPVDAAVAQLMLEGVACQRRMVRLDVELEEGLQVIAAQECQRVRCIEVVLMLGRLESLGLNEEPVSYTHLRAHETRHELVCRLLLAKNKICLKKKKQ